MKIRRTMKGIAWPTGYAIPSPKRQKLSRPVDPEKQGWIAQIRQLEGSIRKNTRQIARAHYMGDLDKASRIAGLVTRKRNRIHHLIACLRERMALDPVPYNPAPRPSKLRVDGLDAPRRFKRWADD